MLTDSHLHLDRFSGARLDEVLDNAKRHGVELLLTVSMDVTVSRRSIELADHHESVLAAVGIHPWRAHEAHEDDFQTLRDLCAGPRVKAIGEIGLDFRPEHPHKEAQMAVFERQVRLAVGLDLPVVVHERLAAREALDVLRREGARRGVLHGFGATEEIAREAVEMGFFIGVGCAFTWPENDGLRRAIGAVPLDRLLVETDAPAPGPEPVRERENEPAHVRHVAEALARRCDLPVARVAEQTDANLRRLLRLM